MGFFVTFLEETIGSLLTTVYDILSTFTVTIGKFMFDTVVTPVFNFLGFTDETIYQTNISISKVYKEDQLPEAITYNAIKHTQTTSDIADYAKSFSLQGDHQIRRYHYHGLYDYTPRLPEARISYNRTNYQLIKNYYKSDTTLEVEEISFKTISDMEYIKAYCRKSNKPRSYDSASNSGTFYISDSTVKGYIRFIFDSYEYDYSSNQLRLKFIPPTGYYKTVILETYDYYYQSGSGTNAKYYHREKETKYYKGIDVNGNEFPLTITRETIVDRDTEITDITGIDFDNIDYTYEQISRNYYSYSTSPQYLSIPSPPTDPVYVISGVYKDGPIIKGDFYDYITSDDPRYNSLGNPIAVTGNIETLPIVKLRNNYIDVVNDKNSDEYKQTQDILHSIKLDVDELTKAYKESENERYVQDAFFLFGVTPKVQEPIVSLVLYYYFEYINKTFPVLDDKNNSYSCGIKENPYNAVLTWAYKKTVDTLVPQQEAPLPNGLGSATHEIRDVNITVTIEYYIVKETIGDLATGGSSKTTKYKKVTYRYEDDIFPPVVKTEQVGETLVDLWDLEDGNTVDLGLSMEEETPEITDAVVKLLIIKKQCITSNKVQYIRTLYVYDLHAMSIIREGVDNGGVNLLVDDERVCIPIPYPVFEQLTLMEKVSLLSSSAHLMFYAVQEQHLKWYQTAKFMSFLQVVAIIITAIITVYSFGTNSAFTASVYDALVALFKMTVVASITAITLYAINALVDDPLLKAGLTFATLIAGAYAGFAVSDAGIAGVTVSDALLTSGSIALQTVDTYVKADVAQQMRQYNTEALTKEYERRTTENEERMAALNAGLSTTEIVAINQSMDELDTFEYEGDKAFENAFVMSANTFFTLALGVTSDIDLMYATSFDSSPYQEGALQYII